jgi:hypothetical protein
MERDHKHCIPTYVQDTVSRIYTQIIIIIIIIIIMVHRAKNLCNQKVHFELSSEIVVHTTNMDRKFYTFSI